MPVPATVRVTVPPALHEATRSDCLLLAPLPLALLKKTLDEPLDTAEVSNISEIRIRDHESRIMNHKSQSGIRNVGIRNQE